eukprot:jgi/Botrbrau1/8706/Bobra.0311s0018.2
MVDSWGCMESCWNVYLIEPSLYQVKAKTVQYEETIAQLQAQIATLLKEKADLQIRCAVLEGLTDAQDAHLDRIRKDKALNDDEEQESILGDAAELSGHVQGHVVTLQEAKQWTLRDIMRMRQKGLHMEMQWLLSGAGDDPDCTASHQLTNFILKRRKVNNRIAVGNPKSMQGIYAFEAMQAREMSDKPTDVLWTRVLDSLQLSKEQQGHFLEAYEILMSCLSSVAERRKYFLTCPQSDTQRTATALLDNLEEERKAVRNFLVCFFDKILSPIQEARCDIYSFPFCPNVLAMAHLALGLTPPAVRLPNVRHLAVSVGIEQWPEITPFQVLSVPATTRCYILTLQRALFMHRSGAMPIELPDVPRDVLLDMSVLTFGR